MKKTFFVLMTVLCIFLAACNFEATDNGVTAPAAGTPLNDFYQAVLDMQPADADPLILFEESNPDLIESFYEGLLDIEFSQMAFYMPPIVTHPCEIVLVEAADADDAKKAAEIFQARIDRGAADKTYPESAAGWQNNAQVQQAGNFVCMIVLPDAYNIPDNIFDIEK